MSAKSVCHAIFFLVAVTFVSGQYLIQTNYEDSSCTTLNGGVYIVNTGPGCVANVSCDPMGPGLYKSEVCADFAPEPPADHALIYTLGSINGQCQNYGTLIHVPLGVCTGTTSYVLKVTGCNAQNSSFILNQYGTIDSCLADGPSSQYAFESGACQLGLPDGKYVCPSAAPVAPPVDPPVNPPMDAPVAPPMDAPMAAPVAAPVAAPKAATPVKKASDATYNNVMIGVTSIISVLVLA